VCPVCPVLRSKSPKAFALGCHGGRVAAGRQEKKGVLEILLKLDTPDTLDTTPISIEFPVCPVFANPATPDTDFALPKVIW
jgi:hypothetical protein